VRFSAWVFEASAKRCDLTASTRTDVTQGDQSNSRHRSGSISVFWEQADLNSSQLLQIAVRRAAIAHTRLRGVADGDRSGDVKSRPHLPSV
jgi:hypothetical protein